MSPQKYASKAAATQLWIEMNRPAYDATSAILIVGPSETSKGQAPSLLR